MTARVVPEGDEREFRLRIVRVEPVDRACAACGWKGSGPIDRAPYAPGSACPCCGAAAEDTP